MLVDHDVGIYDLEVEVFKLKRAVRALKRENNERQRRNPA